MKPFVTFMLGAALLLPATLSFADSTAPSTAKAATTAPSPSATDVTYPYTFVCVHCGMKMTIKSKADWGKGCNACACGMKSSDCLPKKK